MKQISLAIVIMMTIMISCDGHNRKAEPKYPIDMGGERDRDTISRNTQNPDDFAELIDGAYLWSVGDKIGLFMTPAGSYSRVINNLPMTGSNTTPTRNAIFVGSLTHSEMAQISPTALYDYYTYYPYSSSVGTSNFPTITVPLPATMTLQRDILPTQYDIMWAQPVKNYIPLAWLNNNGQPTYDHSLAFTYKHTLSFLMLSLEVNLMSQPITQIVITSNNGTILSGTMNVSLLDGSYGWAGNTSTSMTINITGGLNVNNGVVYIPMRPGSLTGQTLNFKLTTSSGNVVNLTVNGGSLEAGKTHALRLKVPFQAYFNVAPTLGDEGLSGKKASFSYKGWTWGGDGNFEIANYYITYPSSGAMLKTPVLNMATQSGRNSIPVIVRVEVLGGLALLSSNRRIYAAPVSANYNQSGSLPNSPQYVEAPYGSGDGSRAWMSYGSMNMTASLPSIGIQYSPTGAYKGWIYGIEIKPNY